MPCPEWSGPCFEHQQIELRLTQGGPPYVAIAMELPPEAQQAALREVMDRVGVVLFAHMMLTYPHG